MLNFIIKEEVQCTVETQNIVEAFTYEKTVVLWKSCCFQLWKGDSKHWRHILTYAATTV